MVSMYSILWDEEWIEEKESERYEKFRESMGLVITKDDEDFSLSYEGYLCAIESYNAYLELHNKLSKKVVGIKQIMKKEKWNSLTRKEKESILDQL